MKHPHLGDMPCKGREVGAWRRHERLRILQQRYERIGRLRYPDTTSVYPDTNGRFLINRCHGSWADVLEARWLAARHRYAQACPCSCSMCGNPRRRHGELLIQERRAPTAADWDIEDRD